MSESELKPMGLLLVGGRLCLDFCNTVEYREAEQPIELLAKGFGALVRWSHYVKALDTEQATALLALEADAAPIRAVFDEAVNLRETLYRLFKALLDKRSPVQTDLDAINAAIGRMHQQRELASQAEGGLAWRWRNPDASDFMLYPILLSAEALLTTDINALERLRQCPGCGWLFFDESRNRSRQWCDMRFCGNRAKARRFHQRQKSTD
jgi:predicted RNA-binding Zn ribbon-like protein